MDNLFLLKAVRIAGGQSQMAIGIKAWHKENGRDVKVSQAHVWNWLNSNTEQPPAEYVIAIAHVVDWKVTPHDLRPDIYPHPSDGMPRSLCACAEHKEVA